MSADTAVMEKIINDEVKFYLDEDNDEIVYVEYKDSKGAYRFERLGSGEYFLAFLDHRYQELADDDEEPNFARLLKRKRKATIYEQQNLVKINHRVAGSITDRRIAYFLADEKRQTVVITPDKWKECVKTKDKFIKQKADISQVEPKRGGNLLTLLRRYINLNDDDFLLLVIWIVQAFSRKTSHYAAVIPSEMGRGKTTLTKLLRSLIDPSHSGASLTPSSDTDLKTILANTFMACFDNTAPLPEQYSNILCAAITGTKEAKRKLYSDCDQIILNLHNLVVLNGVNVVPKKSDLADRSLLFELQKIDEEKRMTEEEFWRNFEKDKPAILGAIFDTLQKAMQILPTLDIKKLARMADAHKDMIAIALALDIPLEEFQRIFHQNLHAMQMACAGHDEFVDAVVEYVKQHGTQTGRVSEIYDNMCRDIPDGKVILTKSDSWFSRKLNDKEDALKARGIRVTTPSSKKQDGSYITIERIPANQLSKEQRAKIKRSATTVE